MTPEGNEKSVRALLTAAAEADGLRTPERVEKALVAGLRRRNRRMLGVQMAATGALAAVVMLGIFLMRPMAPVPQTPISARTPRAVSTRVAPVAPVAAKAPLKRKPVSQRRAPPAQTDFIPIGPWQAMEPMERGSIIRVRLPKSSLPGFGIPVSADRWHETIPADVVLAEDGTMRAVRFVNTRQ